MTEPRAMREIHEIREKIYEERKHMTPEEWNEAVNAETAKTIKRYNFKVVDYSGQTTNT